MSGLLRSGRAWIVILSVALLTVAHGLALHLLSSRFSLPALLAVGAALAIVATHSGTIGALRKRWGFGRTRGPD